MQIQIHEQEHKIKYFLLLAPRSHINTYKINDYTKIQSNCVMIYLQMCLYKLIEKETLIAKCNFSSASIFKIQKMNHKYKKKRCEFSKHRNIPCSSPWPSKNSTTFFNNLFKKYNTYEFSLISNVIFFLEKTAHRHKMLLLVAYIFSSNYITQLVLRI